MLPQMLIFGLFILYLSISFGTWLKIKSFGVKKNGLLLNLLRPVLIYGFAEILIFKYLAHKEKESNIKISKINKMIVFFELSIVNILIYPILVGKMAQAIKKIESKSKRNRIESEETQAKHAIKNESYNNYDKVRLQLT